ncbi:MAG: IMPACT family protein [Bacteroidota bacterium]
MRDYYYTITTASEEVLFKEKGSKFFGYAFPVKNEKDIEVAIDELKKKHHKARHFCYAWQLGKTYEHFRANDDGEPSNSAGMPIYGQLQSFDVTNCLAVVVRYFGGTKLGVGGLISAYKTTTEMALKNANIVKKTIDIEFKVNCNYDLMNVVMRLIKEENIDLIEQNLEMDCDFTLAVRKKDFDQVINKFESVYGLKIKVPDVDKSNTN